jgi:peptide/nickel transport system substrate-binding protein
VDPNTVRITFKAAKPYPYDVFGGASTPILQRAQFKDCLGDKAPSCSKENFNPSAPARSWSRSSVPTT